MFGLSREANAALAADSYARQQGGSESDASPLADPDAASHGDSSGNRNEIGDVGIVADDRVLQDDDVRTEARIARAKTPRQDGASRAMEALGEITAARCAITG